MYAGSTPAAPEQNLLMKGESEMAQTIKKVEVKAPAEEKLRKIKIGGVEHLVPAERVELERLILKGCALTRALERLQEELKGIKEKALALATEHGLFIKKKSAKLVGLAGVCEITLKQDVKIADGLALRKLFGDSFDRYVAEEIVFKAQKPLRALVADGDYEHRDFLRAAVQVKETEYVRFIPREG
jgi:hypothetical protein